MGSKFGKIHFNEDYFGDNPLAKGDYKRSIHRVPLGFAVRKQLGKRVIFRVRRGNGVAGATLNKLYQDKYGYVVPGNVSNSEGEPARSALKQGVINWQSSLSEEEKDGYNERATHGLHMSGYNLYIKEYLLEAL